MDWEKLESFILSRMSKTRMPSVVISVIKDTEPIYIRAFGFKDLERGLPAGPGTVYGIGSVTKSFTALSILKLVERGLLSLEDEVSKYVPINIKPFGEPIRIHHLLTHTSGLSALGYAEAFIEGILGLRNAWLPVAKPEDLIPFINGATDWVITRPGEKLFYFNEGYALLGLIIEKVSGMHYWDFVRREVLEPLGMNRTYMRAEEVERDLDVAKPYVVNPGTGKVMLSRFPFGITSDGGILSNAIDMSKYVAMLINRGELNGRRVISKESLELAERKYVDAPWRHIGDEGYGYGLIISDNFFGRRLIGHSGNVLVYTAYMGYIPSERLGVVILSNSTGYSLTNMGLYALALALGHDPDKELPFIVRERIIERLEGVYNAYGNTVSFTVTAKGDLLVMKDELGEEFYLFPDEVREDYARFYTFMSGYKMPVEFYMDKDRVRLFFERFLLIKS